MISSEKVGLIAHFYPVLTSYVLLYYKNSIWTTILFYTSLITFIFLVSYLHSLKIVMGNKYNLQITKGFRDDSLKKFALETMPLPYRMFLAFISVLFLFLYIITFIYAIKSYNFNKPLFFILIVIQGSVIVIYALMLYFTRKFLNIFYPKRKRNKSNGK